jgi:hypothetical protein
MTNLLQYFEFAGMVIFRRKNICGISAENYVLCSFKLEKDPIFRICAIRMDLRKKYGLCPISIIIINRFCGKIERFLEIDSNLSVDKDKYITYIFM